MLQALTLFGYSSANLQKKWDNESKNSLQKWVATEWFHEDRKGDEGDLFRRFKFYFVSSPIAYNKRNEVFASASCHWFTSRLIIFLAADV